MKRRFFPLAVAIVLTPAWLASSQESTEKVKVPADFAQGRAEIIIKKLFSENYKNAKTDPSAAQALAATLLYEGKRTKEDDALRYVALMQARDLAAGAGDMETALGAIEALDEIYAVDSLTMKSTVFTLAVQKTTSREASQALAEAALALVDEAIAGDNYTAAEKLVAAAQSAATKAKDLALYAKTERRSQEIEIGKKELARMKQFADKLAKNEKDPEANLEMGKYLCLVKGSFDKGLGYLVKGSDATLKGIAERDLAKPKDVKKQIELADDWHKLAEPEKGLTQRQLLRRALHWYQQALPQLDSGLVMIRVKRQVEELSKLFPGATVSISLAADLSVELRRFDNTHIGGVQSIALSSDGKFAVSGGISDNTLRYWDVQKGALLRSFAGHNGTIHAVAISPDGKYAATACTDQMVRIWDLQAGSEFRRFQHGDWARGVCFMPDGKRLLTASDDRSVRIWDIGNGLEMRRMKGGHTNYINCLAVNKDATRAITTSVDNTVIVWDVTSGAEVAKFQHQRTAWAAAISPDGKRAVTSSYDGTVRVWDVALGKELQRLNHNGMVWAIAFAPDGKRVLTASGGGIPDDKDKGPAMPAINDNALRLWDIDTGKELRRLDGHTNYARGVAFAPDGRWAISCSNDGTIRVWGKSK